jgi:hypothetical protein
MIFDWGLWSHWNDLSTLDWWDTAIGKKAGWIGLATWMFPDYYADSPSYSSQISNIMSLISAAYARDGIPILLWSASPYRGDYSTPIPGSDYYNQRFIDGVFDSYLTALAQALAFDGREVHFRFFWEMNATGYVGSGWEPSWAANYFTNSSKNVAINTPATFKAAWIHIVNIFRNNGASNVKFWFSVGSWPSSAYGGTESPVSPYYPGDSYVDVLGIETYNFRAAAPYDGATTSAVSGMYNEIAALSSSRRMVLAEVGCVSTTDPAGKPAWLSTVLNPTYLTSLYPRLSGLMYWDDCPGTPGATWCLRENTATQNAAVNAFKLPEFTIMGEYAPVSACPIWVVEMD